MMGSRGSPGDSAGGAPPPRGHGAETTPGSPTCSRAGTPPGSHWVRRSQAGSLHTPCPAAPCLGNDRAGQRGGGGPRLGGKLGPPNTHGLGSRVCLFGGCQGPGSRLLSREARGQGTQGLRLTSGPHPLARSAGRVGTALCTVVPILTDTEVALVTDAHSVLCLGALLPGHQAHG